MAVRRSYSPIIKHQTYNLRNSTEYKFPVQISPALSFQQYARSITTLPNTEPWRPSGIYRPPHIHSYLSPETWSQPPIPAMHPWIYSYRRKYSIPTYNVKNYKDIKPKSAEPVWNPPGHYKHKRPTSLSPEKREQPVIQEPPWHPPGRYKDKRPTSLSPEKREQLVIREPTWHPPGRYKDERPTSLSPERIKQKPVHETVWHPAGKPQYKPTPYFDPPNLRWSLEQLRRSMPDLRTKSLRASRSQSIMKSQYMTDFR